MKNKKLLNRNLFGDFKSEALTLADIEEALAGLSKEFGPGLSEVHIHHSEMSLLKQWLTTHIVGATPVVIKIEGNRPWAEQIILGGYEIISTDNVQYRTIEVARISDSYGGGIDLYDHKCDSASA